MEKKIGENKVYIEPFHIEATKKGNNPYKYGESITLSNGDVVEVQRPGRDGSGCIVCDNNKQPCYFLHHPNYSCPLCRGKFVWIDYIWGVVFIKKNEIG